MDELVAFAMARGLRVAWRDLGRRNGELHSSGLILINPWRTQITQKVTLAHELGHAHHGHQWTDDPVIHARQERQADRYAAELLITSDAYMRAEQIVGAHPGALARELAVTRTIIEAWRSSHPITWRTA